MKSMDSIMITAIIALVATAAAGGSADTVDVRGQVADGNFTWNPQNFPGFYYDLKDGLGTETLTTNLTAGNQLSGDEPYGIIYQTTAQIKDFEFKDWDSYYVMGFLSKKYFASYIESDNQSPMVSESTDKNMLSNSQLLEVLLDDNSEETFTSSTPLKLEDGYRLAIRSVDENGKKAFLELTKDGQIVDYSVLSPSAGRSSMSDKTYCYKQDVGDAKDVVILALHFKDALHGADEDIATVDGQWQLSDKPVSVRTDTSYGRMKVIAVDADALKITMNNKENAITLSRNKDITLMPGIGIKTADSDLLRYYIYEPIKVWIVNLPSAIEPNVDDSSTSGSDRIVQY
ncbi:MAG TPA: S-layer protein domain-containing protein [Methanotrichaceae archaeon]|nr:S-layer protein domain-containing protein [Methanotrichaceae archaeon]